MLPWMEENDRRVLKILVLSWMSDGVWWNVHLTLVL